MTSQSPYRYDPQQDSSLIGSFVKGQGAFAPPFRGGITDRGEQTRRDLQQRAVALIEESLADAQASINMETLAPLVMEALDTGEAEDAIIQSLRAPFGLDTQNASRSQQLRAGIEQRPAPSAPGSAPAAPAGGGKKTAQQQIADLRNLVLAAADASVNGKTPEDRAAAETSLLTLSNTYKQVADLADGQVTLQDGTIITSDMLNNPDPVVAQQYQQAFSDRQTAIENENAAVMNAYNMQGYNAQRQSVADQNATAIAQYNAQMASIRERLARDQIDITRAGQEISRALQGLQESRSRTELETKTQLEAAPYATTGGKTEFSGNELGGALAQMQRQGGGDPNTPIIKFPGVITLDPAAGMARRDAELGVTGPLPTVPQLSITDADIPRAPALAGYGNIQMPQLTPPKQRQVIQMPTPPPAWVGYDASGMNP